MAEPAVIGVKWLRIRHSYLSFFVPFPIHPLPTWAQPHFSVALHIPKKNGHLARSEGIPHQSDCRITYHRSQGYFFLFLPSLPEQFEATVRKFIPDGLDGIENIQCEPVKRPSIGSSSAISLPVDDSNKKTKKLRVFDITKYRRRHIALRVCLLREIVMD